MRCQEVAEVWFLVRLQCIWAALVILNPLVEDLFSFCREFALHMEKACAIAGAVVLYGEMGADTGGGAAGGVGESLVVSHFVCLHTRCSFILGLALRANKRDELLATRLSESQEPHAFDANRLSHWKSGLGISIVGYQNCVGFIASSLVLLGAGKSFGPLGDIKGLKVGWGQTLDLLRGSRAEMGKCVALATAEFDLAVFAADGSPALGSRADVGELGVAISMLESFLVGIGALADGIVTGVVKHYFFEPIFDEHIRGFILIVSDAIDKLPRRLPDDARAVGALREGKLIVVARLWNRTFEASVLDMLPIDRQFDVDMQTIKRIEAACSDLVAVSYVHRVSGGDASLAHMKHWFSETVCM